jgi:drug/metabolite transporter (DMT)-like permease
MAATVSLIGSGLLVGVFYAISVTLDKEWVMADVDDTLLIALSFYPLAAIVFFPLYFTEYVTIPAAWKIAASVGVGISFFIPLYLYFRALRLDDASVISTMMRLIPVMTVIFTAVLLGQFLSLQSYFGIAFVLLGASLVAVDFTDLKNISISPGLGFTLATVIGYGLVNVSVEVILSHMELWNYLFWSNVGAAAVAIPILVVRESSRTILMDSLSGFDPALPRLLASKSAELAGVICYMYAVTLGPIGIVSTLSSIEPLFIILLITVWGWISGTGVKTRSRRVWGLRITAAVIVLAGVAFIYGTL